MTISIDRETDLPVYIDHVEEIEMIIFDKEKDPLSFIDESL